MAYPGIPPMGLMVTSCSMMSTAPVFQILLEWENAWDYETLDLQKSTSSGVWVDVSSSIDGRESSYLYNSSDYDLTVLYRIRGYVAGAGYTNWSNVASKAVWYSPLQDTVNFSDLMADAAEIPGESEVVDIVTLTDLVTDSVQILEVVEDTVTLTDQVLDVALEKLVLGRFLGSNNGKLYTIDNDAHGDGAVAIPSWWESKDIDMDDQYPQFIGKNKYLHGIRLRYVDLGEVTVSAMVSTDGGSTWVTNTKTFGTGSMSPKDKIFNFWVHGRTFMVRLYHSSADKDFQWTELELQFEPAGDFFEV